MQSNHIRRVAVWLSVIILVLGWIQLSITAQSVDHYHAFFLGFSAIISGASMVIGILQLGRNMELVNRLTIKNVAIISARAIGTAAILTVCMVLFLTETTWSNYDDSLIVFSAGPIGFLSAIICYFTIVFACIRFPGNS